MSSKRYKGTVATKHAITRLKERVGVTKTGVESKLKKVMKEGYNFPYETPKNINRWIIRIDNIHWEKYGRNGKYIISGSQLYVFNKTYRKLLTVINVPDYLREEIKFMKQFTPEEFSEMKIQAVEENRGLVFNAETGKFEESEVVEDLTEEIKLLIEKEAVEMEQEFTEAEAI